MVGLRVLNYFSVFSPSSSIRDMWADLSKNRRVFGEYALDPANRVLWFRGDPVNLQPKEIEILSVLTERAGDVITKSELMDRIWPDSFVEESNLSRHIYRLRKAFSELGTDSPLIETIPKRGYRFVGDVRGGSDLVIERHSITSTVVDEFDVSPSSTWGKWYTASALVAFVFLASFGVLFAWQNSFTPGSQKVRSIAVLPFRELSTGRASDEWSLGFADLLITKLGHLPDIAIRPTSTIVNYRSGIYDIYAVEERLKVDAVLEGTVVREGDQIRVTAQLVRLSDKTNIWTAQFERDNSLGHRTQNEIALQLVEALSIELSPRSRDALIMAYTTDPSAMDLYQKARFHWNKRDNVGIKEAERLFRNAIERDPGFARAYIGLADTQIFGPSMLAETEILIARALELDPNLGEAYATRGFIEMFHRWRWKQAEEDLLKSIELSPNHVPARQWYAALLMMQRRSSEARHQLDLALNINPISHGLYADRCQAEYYSEEYAAAEASCARSLSLDSDFLFANGHLVNIYFATGRTEAGIRSLGKVNVELGTQPNDPKERSEDLTKAGQEMYDIYRERGSEGLWLHLAAREKPDEQLEPNTFIHRAMSELKLGDRDRALTALEAAVDRHAFVAPFINADPIFKPLWDDPRFHAIVQKMHLPTAGLHTH